MIKSLPVIFRMRLFFYLFLGFIIATVAGTLSHEYGHYFVAKYVFHKNPKIGYAYTSSGYHATYDYTWEQLRHFELLTELGGPVETIFVGMLGLILLFVFRRKYQQTERLSFSQWIPVFLSLFWLRQLFNLIGAITVLLIKGHIAYNADEFRVAYFLGLPIWSIMIVTGIISAVILATVIFKFVPALQRFTFMMAGLAGGLSGAYLWLILLGPILMP